MAIYKSMDDGYGGNRLLKPASVNQSWTSEQVREYLKCAADPTYFILKYLKTVHVDHGLIPLDLYDYQKNMIDHIVKNRYTITIAPRQSGKSTTVAAYLIHFVLFNPNKTVAILANKGSTAREILSRVQTAYQYIPKWLQQGIHEWNKGSMLLENGSRILAGSTSSDSIRGYSISALLIDETAFIRGWEAFYDSIYPTIASGDNTKLILISTPKGFNHFYKIWTEAEKGISDFKSFRVKWDDPPGRDLEYRANQIRNIGEHRWMSEYACEFLGSSNTLISGKTLGGLTLCSPIHESPPTEELGGLKIFEAPVKTHRYVILADTAKGLGGDYDHSCAVVVDITELPYKVTATFRNNRMSPLMLPSILHKLGKDYNEAYVLGENNISEVFESLAIDYDYDNVLFTVPEKRRQLLSAGFGGDAKRQIFGVHMSSSTKRIGCVNLKSLMEESKLLVRDPEIITELYNFISIRNSYGADEGYHDDLVMCLVMFGWMTTQKLFKELTNSHLAMDLFQQRMDKIQDDLTPGAFIDDGLPDEGPEKWTDPSGQVWESCGNYGEPMPHW